jgi:hypothetical protein
MSTEHAPHRSRPLNSRVPDFCEEFGMGRTKFYSLVKAEKIRIIKCGRTSLVTEAERRRGTWALTP